MFGRWWRRFPGRRPFAPAPLRRRARRRARRLGGPLLVIAATLMVSLGAIAAAPPTVAHADDGDLRPRLEAACARIPQARTRLDAAIARLDAPADQRGSRAWLQAAIDRAEAKGRTRVVDDLQHRLDRLTDRRAALDVRVSQLERFTARCAELGAPA
jgi:hypothetical protein